jgi:outer membrane biosynthesis protein TonB
MLRVRGAGPVALSLALILVVLATSLAVAAPRRSDAVSAAAGPAVEPLAAAAWPVSSLVVSEVQTGGASASDEFAELYNGGPLAAELMGLELVYATSTGSTVTRKATWTTSTVIEPGRHLLIANAAGVYAAQADATYSGGFAATGGAVVLRAVGGNPTDAVAWGDATNAFVEGTPAPTPAAGSSIERLPGGSLGNGTDTNANQADFIVAVPSPQNLATGPVPAPGPSSTPAPTPTSVATPTPVPTPTPTSSPTPTPTPTSTPVPTPTPTPTPVPTPSPTPSPTPVPTPTPSPTPTPTPTPLVISSIADARAATDGTTVTIAGTLTTPLGAIDSSRIGFVQDGTGGIAVRLDAALPTPLAPGTAVTVTGSLGSYFSLRTLNVASATIVVTGSTDLPTPLALTTGALDETVEGLRIEVSGIVTEAPAPLADGLGITIDDGSGPIRIVAASAAQAGATVATGDSVMAIGPLGQRDSSGSGVAGYRVHATGAGELIVLVAPSPTPTPTPTPSPTPTLTPTPPPTPSPTPAPTTPPSPTPTPSPTPSASPSATPPPTATPIAISAARALPLGSRVTVGGAVTAEAGRLGTPPLLAIQDGSAGIVVRLADSAARPSRGTWIEIEGTLAAPYGQLEVRSLSRLSVVGPAALPAPSLVDGSTLGEAVEARLVTLTGTVQARPTKASSGDITFVVDTGLGLVRLSADAAAGIAPATIKADDRLRLTGVAGQRASRKGALDGYRVWLRDATDVVRVAGPTPSGSPSPSPTSSPSGSPRPTGTPSAAPSSSSGPTISIAAAIRVRSGTVKVDGTVIAGATLLDATGRRIVVADRSAAIEILLAAGSTAPRVGSRVRITGEVGRAYGAPRIRATLVTATSGGSVVSPLELRVAPGTAHEWRLVRVRGDVVEIHKLGDRWRAELLVGGQRIPISGLAGARIPATTLVEGRTATIVGIVRRPYPSATDRRFAIVPRGPSDVAIGPASDDRSTRSSGSNGASGAAAGSASAGGTGPGAGTQGAATVAQPIDVDLAGVREHVGALVRVGGLVGDIGPDGFALDDGTATGHVLLRGAALDQLPLIETGDALNAIGVVEESATTSDPAAFVVAVTDPAGIVRVGDPIGEAPSTAPSDAATSSDGAGAPDDATTHRAGGLLDAGLPDLGIAGIVLAGLASLAVTLLRRHRMRRQLAARVAQRLSGLAPSPPRSEG